MKPRGLVAVGKATTPDVSTVDRLVPRDPPCQRRFGYARRTGLARVAVWTVASRNRRGVTFRRTRVCSCDLPGRCGEMADAGDLKSPDRKVVRVQVPPAAPGGRKIL